jgi:hypothetical protein
MLKLLLLIFSFFLADFGVFHSENQNSSVENNKSILYEKVYLHIDRELYSPGDDVWFKSYLVSGISHQLIQGYKNVYVQLVAEDGTVAEEKLLLSVNGTANGDFLVPESLPDGTYTIRAYTKYLRNFGEESYFHKKIVVAGAKSSLEMEENFTTRQPSIIDVAFLPEGGSFVVNAINHIAFKAIDETGKGIDVKGRVVDENGNEVVSFRTKYKGMGKFIMMPQEGKSYYALLDGFPDFSYSFQAARPDGIAMNYKPDDAYLIFTLTRNLKNYHPQEFLLVASHKGTELFSSQITMNEFQQAMRLYKGLFPEGISQITIYNQNAEKIAERLVFIRNVHEKRVVIIPDKKDYKSREKVEMILLTLLPENDTILSTVSVSVVNEDYFSASGNNQTIESYLLLDSELKGSIESPASFFVEEPEISGDEKLDMVMMVNGWRSYYWNELEQYAGVELPGWADYGLTLEGNVTRLWGGKPVDYGKVVMGPFSRNFLFEKTTTDEEGDFSFDKLYLKDSAQIMINAETKNRSKRTEIALEQPLEFDTLVSVGLVNSICPDIQVPLKFSREIYYRKIAEQEYIKDMGSILLDEVEIEGKQGPQTQDHFRLYGEPDHSFTITSDDWNYADITDYLQTKAPGVVVSGDEIRIRAGYGNPLLLVDGLEVTWEKIKYIPLGDVDKIEVLKNSALMAVYGSRGGNGVISVLTKMGRPDLYAEYERFVPGRITPRVKGFQQPRKFYSPQYSLNNINDPKPDFRPTLYWNPDVRFDDREAKFEFYTSDKMARYHVFVEGITKRGKIISAHHLLSVSGTGTRGF